MNALKVRILVLLVGLSPGVMFAQYTTGARHDPTPRSGTGFSGNDWGAAAVQNFRAGVAASEQAARERMQAINAREAAARNSGYSVPYGYGGGGSSSNRGGGSSGGSGSGISAAEQQRREAARILAQQQKAAADEQWRKTSGDLYKSFGGDLVNTGTPPAPWDFGPSPYDVTPQQVGLPPQPDGATFVTDDGEVRSVGATGGLERFLNNFAMQSQMAARPPGGDFFDRDPAVVSYDSIGNPIDCDGFVVEYQSPAHRQAAIIEARLAAVEDRLSRSRAYDLTLREPPTKGSPAAPKTAYDRYYSKVNPTFTDLFDMVTEVTKKVQAENDVVQKQRLESIDKLMQEAAKEANKILGR